jgi:large subunit ribosomal protein L4
MKVDLYSETGAKLSAKMELPEEIFGIDPNEAALRQYLYVYRVNQRRGTAKAKTRGEVSGGGRKPWRQKGTGKARHGSIRSPIWVGGGVAHGPKPREFSLSIPGKIARLALRSALSLKALEGKIKILRDLAFKEPKTAKAAALLKKLKLGKRILVVTPEQNDNLIRSFKNIGGVEVRLARNLNAYDVILAQHLVLLSESVGKLKERLVTVKGKGESKETVGGVKAPSSKGKKEVKKLPVKKVQGKATKPKKKGVRARKQ